MPDNAVTLTAVYEKRSTANPGTTNASLNIKSAAFDRNPGSAGYGNVSVTLSSGSYSLSGIRLKGALLTAGKDYTASGGNYTFTSGFLGGLPEGEHGIVFEMSGGTDPVLTVTVTDSTEVWSNPFTDVKAGDWFYEDVAYVHQNRILLGTNETVFSPEQPMTRGMVVTALGRMAGIDPSAYTGSTFGDVAENKYYAPYVLWAAEQGVVEGIGNNLFAPGKNITREDLCLMVCRYAQAMQWELPESRESAGFADEQNIHPYARDAVIALYEAGVINGKPGSRFDPQGTATRAETAAVFCRLSEVIQ